MTPAAVSALRKELPIMSARMGAANVAAAAAKVAVRAISHSVVVCILAAQITGIRLANKSHNCNTVR